MTATTATTTKETHVFTANPSRTLVAALLTACAGTLARAEVYSINTTYAAQAQDRWCGPASAQMMLSPR
ncbi:MAG TPA: hypothetical protein PKU70_07880, partial [Vicinamibacteria bacterium]|nr:hypothetical protein [Vicinamibacteria bacterium]